MRAHLNAILFAEQHTFLHHGRIARMKTADQACQVVIWPFAPHGARHLL
jgi:hypothetical protein